VHKNPASFCNCLAYARVALRKEKDQILRGPLGHLQHHRVLMSNSLIFPWSENVTGNVVFKQAQTVVILSAILENVHLFRGKKNCRTFSLHSPSVTFVASGSQYLKSTAAVCFVILRIRAFVVTQHHPRWNVTREKCRPFGNSKHVNEIKY